jgi:hypothetical protein
VGGVGYRCSKIHTEKEIAMGENQIPICPKCGKPERVGDSYHTHDLDHIFGFGEDDE